MEYKEIEFSKFKKHSDGTTWAPICARCVAKYGVSNNDLLMRPDKEDYKMCGVTGCDSRATYIVNIPSDEDKGHQTGMKVVPVSEEDDDFDPIDFKKLLLEDDEEDEEGEKEEDSEEDSSNVEIEKPEDEEENEEETEEVGTTSGWDRVEEIIKEKTANFSEALRVASETMRDMLEEAEKDEDTIIDEVVQRLEAIDETDLPPVVEDLNTDLDKEIKEKEKEEDDKSTDPEDEEQVDEFGTDRGATPEEAIHTPDENEIDDIISRIKGS